MQPTPFMFAVIPSAFVVGPLTLIAVLAPSFAAAMFAFMRRWSSAFMVMTASSTLLFLHWLLPSFTRGTWWGSYLFLWTLIGALALAGLVRSLRRMRSSSDQTSRRTLNQGEWILIGTLAATTFAGAGYCIILGIPLMEAAQRPLLVTAIGAWSCLFYMLSTPPRSAVNSQTRRLFPEAVLLGAVGLASITLTVSTYIEQLLVDETVALSWVFVADDIGYVHAAPTVAGDRVFVAAVIGSDSNKHGGAVYCINRRDGELLWKFDDGGAMMRTLASPYFWHDRLYIGDGFHQDGQCRHYCLDAKSGNKIWEFATNGHTDATVCDAEGKVYFGAGTAGVYCLDAITGAELWHTAGPRAETKPLIASGCVYGGNGYGKPELYCLDARTGSEIWRHSVDFPSFSPPTADGERVYFCIGNGSIVGSEADARGAIVCLNAATGAEIWHYSLPDGAHAQPLVVGGMIYGNCRDGCCYCLDGESGAIVWKQNLGGPTVSAPRLHMNEIDGTPRGIYVVAGNGMLACLSPSDGAFLWRRDIQKLDGAYGIFSSSPTIVVEQAEHRCHCKIYLGAQNMGRPAMHCYDERVER